MKQKEIDSSVAFRAVNFALKIPVISFFLRFIFKFLLFLERVFKKTRVNYFVTSKSLQIIGVCSPDYRGVRSATYALVDDVVEVSEILSPKKAKEIASKIAEWSPKKVLFSGYPYGYDLLIQEVKIALPESKILVLVHSAFTWFGIYPRENETFEAILELAKRGVVSEIGFVKRDLAEFFKEQGIETCFVMNRFEPNLEKMKELSEGTIKIGIFGSNLWHRNILNQVIGALMLDNTEVHVNELGDHKFLDQKRVFVHGFLPKEEFLKLFSQMDLNLYISLTDCFPMSVVESMSYGIPCLVSDTSDIYAWSNLLQERLTIPKIDSPLAIKEKIEEVLRDYKEIQEEIKKYLPLLKEKAEKSIEEFLK